MYNVIRAPDADERRAEGETAAEPTSGPFDWWSALLPTFGLDHQTPEVGEPPGVVGDTSQSERLADGDIEYDEYDRHWSAVSQPYASGEILLRYLREGWTPGDKVVVQVVRCSSRRCVEVYYFQLLRQSDYLLMPVIATPVILRLAAEHWLTVIRIDADDPSQPEVLLETTAN